MASTHSLEAYLEKAEQDSTKDFHLAFMAKSEFTEFFKKQDKGPHWDSKLAQLTNLSIERSPIFEALLLFGKWKTDKQYKYGVKSAEKFEEMEKLAYERNWVWLLSYCVETAAYIYKTFGHDSSLNAISKRICGYLMEKKDMLPARTLLELTRTFNNIITTADKKDTETIYGLLVDFSSKKFTDDPFNFMRGFLFEAIKIAHFLKLQDRENRLHEQVIQTWVDEAEIKGKSSKLVKFSLLKSALDYSVKIGNKEKIESLKKELSKLDFSDELKEIALPKEEREKFERSAKIYFEKLEKGIEEYVKKLMEMPPLAVILNLCNDSSLIRINVQETRKFVEKLINEHPVQNIFPIMLDTGNKIINMNSPEEKKEYQLHSQLLLGVRETLWMVNIVFEKIENIGIIDSSNIVDFLSRSIGLSENNLEIVSSGVVQHFQKDYVASISILTPLIEGVLFDYLHSIGADISSYEGTTIEQRELGGLLNQKELEDNFGEDFQYFLKLFLIEPDAINFRNRLAHGLASAVEFNHILSSNILFIILKICSKTFKS